MAAPTYVTTQPINVLGNIREWGISASRYGAVVLDTYLDDYEAFKYIGVSVAGDLSVEGLDGVIRTIPVTVGIIPVAGYRIVASGTTAEGLTWYGGQSAIQK